MFLFDFIGSSAKDIAMSIQPVAANAIYWSIVLAAASLAAVVLYESVVDRRDEVMERPTEDQPLQHAA